MMTVNKKRLAITLIAFGLFAAQVAPVAYGVDSNHIYEKQELAEMFQVRKMVRTACAKIKKIPSNPAKAENLLHEAAMETDRALVYWKNFTARYGTTVPSDYKNHPDWNGAVKNIEKSIFEMKRAKDAKTALTFCGRTCANFMALNEKAGIVMTADILFKFRKAAKPLLKPVKTKNFAAIMPSADALTTLRERALALSVSEKSASAPGIGDLNRFSDALDAFIHAAHAKNAESIDARYQTMMSSMEKAYDRFL